jgi:hypothetical protein
MADGGAGSIDAGAAMDEHRFGEFVEILLRRLLIVATSASTSSIHAVSWRSPSRSPVLAKASHGDTETRIKFHDRNADVLVGISTS